MDQTAKKINYAKWTLICSIVLALISTIVAIAYPEIRCKLGLGLSNCAVNSQKEVELISQAETGEAIAGVMVKVIAKGPPEVQYTDSNGYAKVAISSTGDVHVNLSKSGYTNQDFFINLANDQNTVRIIRFNRSGKPEISSAPTITQALQTIKLSSPISQVPAPPSPVIAPIIATYENDYIKASTLGASFDTDKWAQAGLIIENKTGKDLLLAYEPNKARAISNLGQASTCSLEGLAESTELAIRPDPLSFSTLKPKTKITTSASNCQNITPESKANSISVNIPIVMLEDGQYKKFTLDLNGIPLPNK